MLSVVFSKSFVTGGAHGLLMTSTRRFGPPFSFKCLQVSLVFVFSALTRAWPRLRLPDFRLDFWLVFSMQTLAFCL